MPATAYPADVRPYTFPCANVPEIAAGQTISAVTGVVSIPTGVTIGATAIIDSGTAFTVVLSGGTGGQTYAISATFTTSGGSTIVVQDSLTVLTPG